MIILKLGGSLLSSAELPQWLRLASEQGQGKLVIVPGGGVFADQVRLMQAQWYYNDQIAHYMALLAMQQVALLLQGLCPHLVIVERVAAIAPALAQQQVVLWSPLAVELDADNVPASWDVTSDSLAAWLAVQLSAVQLVLVKSVAVSKEQSVEQWAAAGVVDKAFVQFVRGQDLTIRCLGRQQLALLAACLT